jgi:AhpD family alkylhydroperoxidase
MTSKPTPWYMLHSPEIGKKYSEFQEACVKHGVLDEKMKNLIMFTAAAMLGRAGNIEVHIQKALMSGLTRDEITEALLIVSSEAADAQLTNAVEIYKKYLANESYIKNVNMDNLPDGDLDNIVSSVEN